ncbi:MAG: hypothetical protein Kow0075_00550 [Salibacteraceae bacterium]
MILALAVFYVALLSVSCNRGITVGTVADVDTNGLPSFDTFDFPTSKYYFYGKFDGRFILWQDGMRSKWDTTMRIPDPNNPDLPYNQWPAYTKNIYINVPSQRIVSPCRYDSSSSFIERRTRFIRPEFPDMRMDIYFYGCVDMNDTNNAYYPNNQLSAFKKIANPFTDIEYGRDGVRLVYTDQNRVQWSTEPGSGQLNDTYFRLTDFYKNNLVSGTADTLDTVALYIVEGEFAGRLFSRLGEMVVTEAKFKARVVPDN